MNRWFHHAIETHYSIADQFGNVVSNTYTINFSFGSGIVVPGTGMLLNNEMDDFAAKSGFLMAMAWFKVKPMQYRQAVDRYPL